MKKSYTIAVLALFIAASFQLGACSKNSSTAADSSLSVAEKQGLLFMREEEKLAFDVYNHLHTQWGLLPFLNISQSEASHMAAVKTLLDRYNLPDPAAGKAAGEFGDPVLAALYTTLIQKGDSSEVQALLTGALIEEVDIRDLKLWISQTTKTDLLQVFNNLMLGSRNHLRSFVSNLASRGVTYSPVYLSQAEYDAIINSPWESGGYGRGQ